jgi:hypothetical protein
MLPDLLRAVVRDHAGADEAETDNFRVGHKSERLCGAVRPVANAFALSPKAAYFAFRVWPFLPFFRGAGWKVPLIMVVRGIRGMPRSPF